MNDGIKIGLWCLAGLVLVCGIAWIAQGNDFFMYKYFAPKYAAVQRDVFENTPSYNQGMIQELQNMQFEYIKATPTQQVALRKIILHRAAPFPENKMPVDLKLFIQQLKADEAKAR